MSEAAVGSLLRRLLFSNLVGQFSALLFFVLVGYFFGIRETRFFLVPSSSMEPTLINRDQVITMKDREYKRGDIIVIRDPALDENLVKRLVGLPGDTIQVTDGALFINGAYASEPYVKEPMEYLLMSPVVVPEGHIFLLGDNRNQSEDSHTDGRTFSMSDIVGRVVYLYFPYERFGAIRSYPLTNLHGA